MATHMPQSRQAWWWSFLLQQHTCHGQGKLGGGVSTAAKHMPQSRQVWWWNFLLQQYTCHSEGKLGGGVFYCSNTHTPVEVSLVVEFSTAAIHMPQSRQAWWWSLLWQYTCHSQGKLGGEIFYCSNTHAPVEVSLVEEFSTVAIHSQGKLGGGVFYCGNTQSRQAWWWNFLLRQYTCPS